MRNLLACTAMSSVLAAMAIPVAQAETTISTATTTALKTSTAASGQPDSITISSNGSVTVTTGSAVTMDSNNGVNNAGKISITGSNNSNGILVNAGTTGDITNSSTITVDEDYTATDTDSDGDIDGPFAQGNNRNGILVSSGGTHSGSVAQSGTITVEGNQSAGIRIDDTLNGKLTTSGSIVVTGDNSYGIKAGAITGDTWLQGSVSVVGANSVGVALTGDIGGALKVQGSLISTGYRSTTAPTDVTKLDADDLLQGGSALIINGNVAGGIIFDIPPTDTDTTNTDEDGDGVTDTSEGTAAVTTYGSAPAVVIGAADHDISIGAVTSDTSGYGVIVKGSIAGAGVYTGVDANALLFGGQGGDVTVAKGLSVSGTIVANSLDSNATAIRFGSGSSVPAVVNSGTISAVGASFAGTTARAIVIDAGANVTSLTNSGGIAATARVNLGAATAIYDATGTLSSITNTGKISASGGATGANIALDLRANTSGVTINQSLASSTASAPSIVGDIYTGSGDDSLTLSAGSITGDINLGAGNGAVALSGSAAITGDLTYGGASATLSLAGTSAFTGDVNFAGSTGSMTLGDTSIFSGQLLNSGNINLTINGGTLGVTNTGMVALASLTAGATSIINVTIDGAASTNTLYDVSGAASFANGSQVRVKLTQVTGSEGEFTFVKAGSLSGAPVLTSDSTLLPYMYKGSIASDATAGTVTLDISRKTTSELGLNGSESRAYDAVYAALDKDADVARSFLNITDGDSFRSTLKQMLPDHAGGAFETVTGGSRAMARILTEPGAPVKGDGGMSMWLEQVAWGGSKNLGDTASYDINGWGATGGVEFGTAIGRLGVGVGYLHGSDDDGDTDNSVATDQFELSGHWRGGAGPLRAFARVSAAIINFDGQRLFSGNNGTADVSRKATGKWNGQLYSGSAGVSYEQRMGRFSLRPLAFIDYYRLNEDGYSETGGGDAFDLTVASRKSDELAANGSLTMGYDLASIDEDHGWFRVELEGGRRQLIGGALGDTTAHFKDGDDFTLIPEQRDSGWTGKFRLVGGSDLFRAAGEFSAEQQQSNVSIAFRASLSVAM